MARIFSVILVAALCLAPGVPTEAGALLEPVVAPEWEVTHWLNDQPGSLPSLRGKIVVLEFFQLWCPASNGFSLPLMSEWEQKFAERDNVVLLSIHSVFEGHELQSPELLEEFVRQRGITRPVGIDAYEHPDDTVPISMERFEARGTPHIVIIDRKGRMRFSHFGWFDRGPVEAFIERLSQNRTSESGSVFDRKDSGGRKRSRSNPPPRPAPPKPVPPVPTGDDATDPQISGTYKLVFEQTAKTCGDLIKPQQLIAELVFGPNTVSVRSVRPFLGLRRFKAAFQPTSGTFEADLAETARQRGVELELEFEISGRLDRTAKSPSIEFEFNLDKSGGSGEWDCYVSGKGSGTLSKPGR